MARSVDGRQITGLALVRRTIIDNVADEEGNLSHIVVLQYHAIVEGKAVKIKTTKAIPAASPQRPEVVTRLVAAALHEWIREDTQTHADVDIGAEPGRP